MTLSVVGIFGLTTGTAPVVLAVELLVAVDMVVLVLAVEMVVMDAGLGWVVGNVSLQLHRQGEVVGAGAS